MKSNFFFREILLTFVFIIFHYSNAYPIYFDGDTPNILIIIADDLGWHDVGYLGSSIRTPNIDKLADSGVRLDRYYVMPTCTPTRVSLMTGKYPSRYGITFSDYGEVIDMGDPTLASIMASNGYSTTISGKWHLGSPPYTPLKYGFHNSYGYFASQIDPYTHEYKAETKVTSRKSWHRNDEYLEEEGHATDLITHEAIRIIENKDQKPFFLYVSYSVPHYPLDEPEEWTSIYDDMNLYPSRKWFAASVTHMDDGIGKIIEALENSGQRENTLVIFFSDNGGQHSWYNSTHFRGKYADKPHRVLGNNFPLRGWKIDLYEGGIRVPAFVNWPGVLVAKSVNQPLHVSDWLPTICDLIGAKKETENLKLDGQNIWPILTGELKKQEKRAFYWKTDNNFAVQENNWKLLVHRNTDEVELYNLETDFRERNDIREENPEMVNHLINLLQNFMEDDRAKE
jgi:arylsulfatase A-like enzyme